MTTVKNINTATNIDGIQVEEQATIATPATGLGKFAFKTDGLPYAKNDAGTEFDLSGGGGGTHASDHLTGGSDEIDGDKLDIDFTPSNYTPATTPSEADNVDNLTAHLYGIDQALASSGSSSIAILQHQETSGTDGGGITGSSWNHRPLDTEVSDADSIVTITSDTFRPISGTYTIRVSATIYSGGFTRLRLYNIDDTSVVGQGNSGRTSAGQNSVDYLELTFSANGTDDYRIEHYSSATTAGNGFGDAVGSGQSEVFMTIALEKVA